MKQLAIDQGYSSAKIKFDGRLLKFPTAVAFVSDSGMTYGDDEVFEYNGENYFVGDEAVSSEAFVTSDFGFKKTFDPLLLFFILTKLNLVEEARANNVKLYLTLALADWRFKDEYLEIFKSFTVNGITLGFEDITLLPQGSGAYIQYMGNREEHPSSSVVLDIGANTVNFLAYENGQPSRSRSRGFPGHGVLVSIVQPFASYLESTYNMRFSNAEAQKIFTNNKFIFNGVPQENVQEKIQELKAQFVKKLFNSILTQEKKQLSTSEVVLVAGGGCYLLEGINFPPNVQFVEKPYEFANIAGVI